MNRRFYLLPVGGALISGGFASAQHAPDASRPNIVFVLADDLGIGDLGCYGQKLIQTPHIDRLAANGLRFTQHYSGSTVSAPSRCALLTGKDMGHACIRGNHGTATGYDSALPPGEVTVAEVLKTRGYATACVGKWGLGGPGTSGSPMRKGFDYFFGYMGQGAAHRYYPEYVFENEEKVSLGGRVYSHSAIMDRGIGFIERHAAEPFFVYFAITLPHADLDYPDLDRYRGKFDEPPFDPDKKGAYLNNPAPRATYASMVGGIDDAVGRILRTLDSLGVAENTILIFSSDNGVHQVGGHDPEYFDSNGPFRGYKRDLYEGGVRTPFVVSWPSVIGSPREAGHISAFWDFLPTVCEITGASVPEGVNGISYLPTLRGDDSAQRKHDYIYYEFYERGGKQSILRGGWKLVRLNMDTPAKMTEELYHLDEDPSEQKNLLAEHPGKADELRDMLTAARTENANFRWGANNKK